MKAQVDKARQIQLRRFAGRNISFNSEMTTNDIKKYCALGKEQMEIMDKAYTAMRLTGRGYHKILKTARTIADLDESEDITAHHLYEAISFRNYDRGMN